jgi:hypothetical protein
MGGREVLHEKQERRDCTQCPRHQECWHDRPP